MDYINRLDNYDGPEIAKIVGDPRSESWKLFSVFDSSSRIMQVLWLLTLAHVEALGDPYGLYEEAGFRSIRR